LQGDVDECMEDSVEKLGHTIGKTRGDEDMRLQEGS